MSDAVDMIMPMLGEMRAGNARLRGEHSVRFDRVEQRLAKIEGQATLTSETLLSRLVTGEFEGRIEALEAEVRELEARK